MAVAVMAAAACDPMRPVAPALLALAIVLAGCTAPQATDGPDLSCVVAPRDDGRLAGAYLRWPAAEAESFAVIGVTGDESRSGQPRTIAIGDLTLQRIGGRDVQGAGLRGSDRSTLKLRPGFGAAPKLPNVYDLGYSWDGADYAGLLAIGHSPGADEMPTSGGATYSGVVLVEMGGPAGAGGSARPQATGRFTLTAGFGTQRGQFTADLAGGGLPFTRISWSNLFLCGGRFVSSGQGQVLVTDAAGTHPPFQGGADPVPLVSSFAAALIAPATRPAAPFGVGGAFAVQSDLGAITGTFMTDAPP